MFISKASLLSYVRRLDSNSCTIRNSEAQARDHCLDAASAESRIRHSVDMAPGKQRLTRLCSRQGRALRLRLSNTGASNLIIAARTWLDWRRHAASRNAENTGGAAPDSKRSLWLVDDSRTPDSRTSVTGRRRRANFASVHRMPFGKFFEARDDRPTVCRNFDIDLRFSFVTSAFNQAEFHGMRVAQLIRD
jgi:hypothetical protein